MSILLWFCFGLSGVAALAVEMLWMRSASLVLGATAPTAATVLACYFAGLGLGAIGARRGSPRPVRLYARLEIGAGLGALWSLLVFGVLANGAAQSGLVSLGTLGRIAAVAIAILPTTLCLGATLPAIGQALIRAGAVGRRGGFLYALNTLGGVFGAAATGFGLPALIGVQASYGVAAGASLLAGTIALTIGDKDRTGFSPGTAVFLPVTGHGRLGLVAACTGALGLGLEVLWTRLFAQVLHNSVYSFIAVAVVFLLAIALGAAIAAFFLRRTSPPAVASVALVVAAATTVGGLWFFLHWTDGLAYFGMQSGLGEYLLRIVTLAAVTAGPAAIASGAVLPALWAAWGHQTNAAHPLGSLSAANMLGGAVGAAVTGFFIIPSLGIRGSLFVIVVVYMVLADVLAPPHSRLRPVAYAVLLITAVADPLRAPLVHLRPEDETLRTLVESAEGVTSVVEKAGDLQLRLDNYYVLGGSAAAANERRQGLLPLLLHPAPRRVAFIGLATGISASAGPALGVEETTVVELIPAVAAAARTHFAAWNARLLERTDVRLVIDDGRRYLAATADSFDVIISDLFIPWHAGTGNLYAREMYAVATRRLAPGGIFCQWLPLYQLTREEFEIIVHTFLAVFPHVSLWRDDFYADRPVVGLVGQFTAPTVDLTRVRETLLRLPDWSRDPQFATPQGLIMLYAGDLTAVADLFGDAPVNTDDRPLIEFLAPRLTRASAIGDKDWFTGEALATFYDTLDTRLAGSPGPFRPMSEEVTAARRAGTALFHYALASVRHEDAVAGRLQTEIRQLVPDVILAAESGVPTSSLKDARQELAGLQAEQDQVRRRLEEMERRLGELTQTKEETP